MMDKENLQVVHNAAANRFEMDIEGKKALVNYQKRGDERLCIGEIYCPIVLKLFPNSLYVNFDSFYW